MILKLGTRKIERLRFIAKQGKLKTKKGRISKEDPDGVLKFCKRTGYMLVDSQPVHRILLVTLLEGRIGKKHLPPVKNPLKIMKGLAVYTAERPLK